MGSPAKEKIFDELRNYHIHQFPAEITDPAVKNLLAEFGMLEDGIVNRILGHISGREELGNHDKELKGFQEKLDSTLREESPDESCRVVFVTKINHLILIIAITQESQFQLKPQKKVRERKGIATGSAMKAATA